MPVDAFALIQRTQHVVFSDLGEELLILDAEGAMVHSLNLTARAVWLNLATPTSFSDLRDKLMHAFAVGHDECQRDLIEILTQLEQAQLVHAVTEP